MLKSVKKTLPSQGIQFTIVVLCLGLGLCPKLYAPDPTESTVREALKALSPPYKERHAPALARPQFYSFKEGVYEAIQTLAGIYSQKHLPADVEALRSSAVVRLTEIASDSEIDIQVSIQLLAAECLVYFFKGHVAGSDIEKRLVELLRRGVGTRLELFNYHDASRAISLLDRMKTSDPETIALLADYVMREFSKRFDIRIHAAEHLLNLINGEPKLLEILEAKGKRIELYITLQELMEELDRWIAAAARLHRGGASRASTRSKWRVRAANVLAGADSWLTADEKRDLPPRHFMGPLGRSRSAPPAEKFRDWEATMVETPDRHSFQIHIGSSADNCGGLFTHTITIGLPP